MRKLWLENERGVTYNFDDNINCLSGNLANFGVEISNTYYEYTNTFSIAHSKMVMMKPTFNAYFLKGYKGYQEFITFAYSAKELKLYYTADDTKYCYVDLERVSKSEMSANNVIVSQLVFNKKSMWTKENVITISTHTNATNKKYNYTYNYTYLDNTMEEIYVENNGTLEAPLNVTIRGRINSPRISIYVDDELYQETVINVSSDNINNELVIISDEGKEEMYMKENGVKTNVYQFQDFSKNGFLYLPLGTSKIVIHSGENTQSEEFIITYHELYRGN